MTQFEVATAAAFVAFAARRVEVAVVEAGLGGRLDATNTIPSRVTVLTSIGLDHTEWLGETELEIAAEKLAVLRDHTTLVGAGVSPEVAALAERTAAERGAEPDRRPGGPRRGRRAARARAASSAATSPSPAPRRRRSSASLDASRGRRGRGRARRPGSPRARRRRSAGLPRRRPQPRRRRRARRGAGGSRRRPPGRRLPRGPRRQGRRGDDRGPRACPRSRRLHRAPADGACRRRGSARGRLACAGRRAGRACAEARDPGRERPRTRRQRCTWRASSPASAAGSLLVTGSHYLLAPARAAPWPCARIEPMDSGGKSAGSELLSMMAPGRRGRCRGDPRLLRPRLPVRQPLPLSQSSDSRCDRVRRPGGEVDCPLPLRRALSHGTSDLRHRQRRPQPGRQPLRPDARRRLAGADRLHLLRRPSPHLRPVPGRLRHDRLASSLTSAPPSTRSCARRSSSRTPTNASWRSRPPSCGCAS